MGAVDTFAQFCRQFPKMDAMQLAHKAMKEVPEACVVRLTQAIVEVRRDIVQVSEQINLRPLLSTLTARPTFTTQVIDGKPHIVAQKAGQKKPVDLEPFKKFLLQTFTLGKKEIAVWGTATVEQHQQRITLLSSQVKGFHDTIRRHKDAIAAIEKARVKCLNDLVK